MKPVYIIPAYQPDNRFIALIQSLSKGSQCGIIVVDDGSREECKKIFSDIAAIPGIILLRHAVNLGKGAALKTAFNYVLLNFPQAPGVITIDADGQHLPADVEKVAAALINSPQKLCLGIRSFRSDVPLRSQFGNLLTRYVFRFLIGKKLQDTQTGLRGIPLNLLPRLLRISNNRYEFELDMLVQAAQSHAFLEVPIQTVYEEGNKSSHFNPVLDSLRIYFVFFRFLFASLATYFVDITTFTIVYFLTDKILPAFFAGRLLGLFVAIYGAKVFVFRSNKTTQEVAPKFLLLWLSHMSLSYGLIYLFTNTWHFNVYLCRVLVDVFLYAFNFLIQREFIFSRSEKD